MKSNGQKLISLFLIISLLILPMTLTAKERQGAELHIQRIDGQQVKGELIAVKKSSLLLKESNTGSKINNIIASITMVAFFILSLSCSTTPNLRINADTAKRNRKVKILQMETKSGPTIEFSEEQPGRISEDNITGVAVKVTGIIEIDNANIEREEKEKDGKFIIIITKDKKVYKDFRRNN